MSIRRCLEIIPRASTGEPPIGVKVPPAAQPILPNGLADRRGGKVAR